MPSRPPSAYWSDMVRGLDGARISTIHSFCAALLRTFAVEAGLDPQFEVLEQAQSETLLSEAVDDTLRRLVAERERATIELAARFDLVGVRSMARVLAIEAAGAALSRWLELDAAEQVARWTSFYDERVVPAVVRRIATSPALRMVESIMREHEPAHPKMQARRAVLLETLPVLRADPPSGEALAALFGTIRDHAKVQGGGTAKHWDSEEVYGSFRDAAVELRGLIDGAVRMLSYDPAAALEAAKVGQQLLAVAAEVGDGYRQRKQELAALDFDDLLRRARDLLVDPRHAHVRERLEAQIHLLLVDEFQDTDRVQVELVRALCGEAVASGKLFFVGDYKQSIYRFRGAEPDVFRQLRDATPERGRLSLTENFRSQPAILEFVNGLFWHELGGGYEPLRAHRPQSTPQPAVEFLWAQAPPGTSKEDVRSVRRREADWIAVRVAAMLDGGERLVGEPLPAHRGRETPRAPVRAKSRFCLRAFGRRAVRGRAAPSGHRLLPGRRTRVLCPTGDLRPAEPAADSDQSERRREPRRSAAQRLLRPDRRDAVLAGPAS